MNMKKKRIIGILLTLVLVLGLMLGMSMTAHADDPYASIKNTTTLISFDSKIWYLIDSDDSTVTLLSKECVGASQYNSSDTYVVYASSTVKSVVDNWYDTNISLDAKTAVNGGMSLLTTWEAQIINPDVLKCSEASGASGNFWWLRDPQGITRYHLPYAYGSDGKVVESGGSYFTATYKFGVRPALKLKLSSVVFLSESNTFLLKQDVTGVTLNKSEIILNVNGTEILEAAFEPADTDTRVTDKAITFKSSNIDVATVDSNGKITAVGSGIATITVTATNGTPEKSDDKTATCTVKVNKPESKVTKVPTANNPTYTGNAQQLVTAGTAEGGTMNYALGTDATNAPTSGWSTSIPTGVNAGTYYVWYKVIGDADHYDSSPAVVTVTIATKQSENKQPEKNTPAKESEQKVEGILQLNSRLRLYWKGSNVVFRWGKVSGADTYEIWMAYCGSKKLKKVRTVHNVNSIVVKKLGGKKPDQKRNVRAYVIACRNGTKIGRSLECHSAGPKNRHSNAKKIKTAKNTYKLKVGRAAKLTAKTIKIKRGRPLLGKGHCARFRYASSDNHVATVSKNGKIRAVGAGKCNVWVYAKNGISRKVTVIVQ